MNTHKVNLFFHAIKYFAIRSWAKEKPTDLAYDQLLDKAKCHKTAVGEYNHDKESRNASMLFPSTVSVSTDAVHLSDSYNRSSTSRTCSRHSVTHSSYGH